MNPQDNDNNGCPERDGEEAVDEIVRAEEGIEREEIERDGEEAVDEMIRAEEEEIERQFREREETERDEAEAVDEMIRAEEAGIERQIREREEMEDTDNERIRAEEERRRVTEEQEQHLDIVDYDIAIPSQHSYLDMPLQRIESMEYSLVNQTVNLFLIPLDVLVMPGQTVPLRVKQNSLQFTMIRALLDCHKTSFGAVYLPSERSREQMILARSWSKRGVTVQILEVSDDTPEEIVLLCKGRQRFRVKQIQRPSDAILRANVEILGDPVPDRIYCPNGKMRDFVRKGPHPAWMYKLHDVYHIMQLIKNVIKITCPLVKIELAPHQPDMFSYWLITAMPFASTKRVEMLREDSLVARLKSQLKHARKLNRFKYCCGYCESAVISSNHLVSMSSDSPYFVNPHGMAFELVTAYSVTNAIASGTPRTEDSWFPGYGWSFLQCARCRNGLGWKFTAVTSVTPRVFYGAQRRALGVIRRNDHELESSSDTDSGQDEPRRAQEND